VLVSSCRNSCSMLSCWAPLPVGLQQGEQGAQPKGEEEGNHQRVWLVVPGSGQQHVAGRGFGVGVQARTGSGRRMPGSNMVRSGEGWGVEVGGIPRPQPLANNYSWPSWVCVQRGRGHGVGRLAAGAGALSTTHCNAAPSLPLPPLHVPLTPTFVAPHLCFNWTSTPLLLLLLQRVRLSHCGLKWSRRSEGRMFVMPVGATGDGASAVGGTGVMNRHPSAQPLDLSRQWRRQGGWQAGWYSSRATGHTQRMQLLQGPHNTITWPWLALWRTAGRQCSCTH
jgi:hypothetical protein